MVEGSHAEKGWCDPLTAQPVRPTSTSSASGSAGSSASGSAGSSASGSAGSSASGSAGSSASGSAGSSASALPDHPVESEELLQNDANGI